jgi:hypothetical protein
MIWDCVLSIAFLIVPCLYFHTTPYLKNVNDHIEMNILYFTSSNCDNMEDAYLHGLRSLFGTSVVDYPKKEMMYRGWSTLPDAEMYGRLFTLWRTLDDLPVDRTDIDRKLRAGFFDLVVFGSILRTQPFYQFYEPFLNPKKTIMLDGEDHNDIIVRAARKFVYFKRELLAKASYYYNYKLVPKFLYQRRTYHPNVLPISFAIPKEKITTGISRANKTRLFPAHIVDEELRTHARLAEYAKNKTSLQLVFEAESEYYQNLQASKFGITTKRGGWDCLRHYEVAANGAVMCFRDLNKKYRLCAPHGLNAENCMVYSSADSLLKRIDTMPDREYDSLLMNGYEWVASQSTDVKAADMIHRAEQRFRT